MREYCGYFVTEDGRVINKHGKQLRTFDNGRGYQILQLRINEKAKNFAVHRLVAELYVPNPDNLPEVGHDDGDKQNNHYRNLVWCTRSQNIKHAYDNDLRSAKGVNNARAVLDESDVVLVCGLLEKGESCQKIHEKTQLPYHAIRSIRRRSSWKDISSSYSW